MAREPKPQHLPYLQTIKDKVEAEEQVRARAAAQVREATLTARAQTNEAIVIANANGVTKEAIRDALGVSYTTIVKRIQEHHVRTGYAPTKPVEGEAPAPVTDPKVRATKDDTGYTVTLEHFTHPDVGTDLSGWAIFDLEGEFKLGSETTIPSQRDDPLWADKLWATKEVQDAVEHA